MDIREVLRERSKRDLELLARNRRYGDDLSKPRQVTFTMASDSEESAARMRDLALACNYGEAWVRWEPEDEEWKAEVRIVMAIWPESLCAVSGLMAALAQASSLRYEGWGCPLMVS